MIYLFLLIMLVVFEMLERVFINKRITLGKNEIASIIGKFNRVFFFVCLVLITSFRHISIGKDTIAYYERLNIYRHMELMKAISYYNTYEYGSIVLGWLCSRVSFGFRLYIFLMSLIYFYAVFLVYGRYSKSFWLSIVFFIGLGFFTSSFTIVDQTFALAFSMLAFYNYHKNNLFLSLVFFMLAISFHLSAIVLIFSLISKAKFKSMYLFLFMGFSVATLTYKANLYYFLSVFVKSNFTETEMGGKLFFIFLFAVFIFCIYYHKKSRHNNSSNAFLWMIAICFAIYPISLFHPALSRLIYYYLIFMPILLVNTIIGLKGIFKSLFFTMFSLSVLYHAISNVFTISKRILPYRFMDFFGRF